MRRRRSSQDFEIMRDGDSSIPGNLCERLDEMLARLKNVETALDQMLRQKSVKDWYSTSEVAALLSKAEFTVREWCRLGRIAASKKQCGRGISSEWMISHEELTRIRNEGLLPDPRAYRHVK